jgi:hypothetical protein
VVLELVLVAAEVVLEDIILLITGMLEVLLVALAEQVLLLAEAEEVAVVLMVKVLEPLLEAVLVT